MWEEVLCVVSGRTTEEEQKLRKEWEILFKGSYYVTCRRCFGVYAGNPSVDITLCRDCYVTLMREEDKNDESVRSIGENAETT